MQQKQSAKPPNTKCCRCHAGQMGDWALVGLRLVKGLRTHRMKAARRKKGKSGGGGHSCQLLKFTRTPPEIILEK